MRNHPLALVLVFLALPSLALATSLVNINTADATLLDTLPGIGPSKATAIVDYRTRHGFFARTQDIQNVSGIGPSTYAGLAPFITVGDMSTSVATTTTATTTSSATSTTPASGGAATYVPPPSAISISAGDNQSALLEVPLHLSAQATLRNGTVDTAAQILWSFGDGSSGEGRAVEKTYRYTGVYLVRVIATDGGAKASDEFIVTVKPAKVHPLIVSGDGIIIGNDSTERLDLSGWRLLSDAGSFRIPSGTVILPESSVLFPFAITNLPMAFDATLMYPSGVVATRTLPAATSATTTTAVSVPTMSEQPPAATTSYSPVKAVEPITSPQKNIQAHEQAVIAPTAAVEPAAVGAALPPAEAAPAADTRATGLFHSPWTFGLLGAVALAGGAFIFL